MNNDKSTEKEYGIYPVKGEGRMTFRFHEGPQRRINRIILLGTGTFVELQKGARDILGKQADAVFYEAGIRSGIEGYNALKIELNMDGNELIKKLFSFTNETGFGWFKVEALNIGPSKKRGSIKVSNSFIGDTYGKADKPVCHFIAGFIAGFISSAWGTEVECEETSCAAVKGDYCIFSWEATA